MSGSCCDLGWEHPGECLFDGCTCCGGEYPFGLSTSSLCGTCTEGERMYADADSSVSSVALPWPRLGPPPAEEPF